MDRFDGWRGRNQQASLDRVQPLVLAQQKALAGTRNLVVDRGISIDRQYQPLPVLQRIATAVNKRKMGTIHQDSVDGRVDTLEQLLGIAVAARNGDAIVEMKVAPSAIIIETIGDVRILLELKQ